MKNFDWTQFTRKIAIKSTLPEMYDAWTKAAEIEKWFLSKALFYDHQAQLISPDSSVQKGYTYDWNWHTYEPTESGKILEANGIDQLSFSFAGTCIVNIKLSMQKENVLVELSQRNIPTDEDSMKNIRLGCDAGWSFYIVNLKSVYEGGLDLRNKDPEFKSMVNS